MYMSMVRGLVSTESVLADWSRDGAMCVAGKGGDEMFS